MRKVESGKPDVIAESWKEANGTYGVPIENYLRLRRVPWNCRREF